MRQRGKKSRGRRGRRRRGRQPRRSRRWCWCPRRLPPCPRGGFYIRKASARSKYVADPQGAVHQNGGKATTPCAAGCGEQDPRNHSPPQGRGCTGEQTGWRRWMGGYPARPTHGGWIDHRVGRAVAGHPESWTNPAPCASQAARGDPRATFSRGPQVKGGSIR